MSSLLGELTDDQANRLWWRLVRALAATTDEIDCLELASAAVRDTLYGPGCLESYRALRDELADLADNDVRRTAADWKSLLAGHTLEGNPSWQESAHGAPRPAMTWSRLAARISLGRAWRRMTPRK